MWECKEDGGLCMEGGEQASGMLLVAACKWMHASYQYV